MFRGKSSAILGMVAQAGAVCFWAYLGLVVLRQVFTGNPVAIVLDAFDWGMAAATAYCIYRQVQWVQEDQRLKRWLVMNSANIRNNQPVFYRSQRMTMVTELVRHHLVFSIVILSFRMQTRWIIKDKEPRFGHALAASLYTLCYGWWGFPFGLFWTPVALVKNFQGSTTVRVGELLQPAPAKPVGFQERFEKNFSQRVKGGLFIDEKPAGIFPVEPVAKNL